MRIAPNPLGLTICRCIQPEKPEYAERFRNLSLEAAESAADRSDERAEDDYRKNAARYLDDGYYVCEAPMTQEDFLCDACRSSMNCAEWREERARVATRA